MGFRAFLILGLALMAAFFHFSSEVESRQLDEVVADKTKDVEKLGLHDDDDWHDHDHDDYDHHDHEHDYEHDHNDDHDHKHDHDDDDYDHEHDHDLDHDHDCDDDDDECRCRGYPGHLGHEARHRPCDPPAGDKGGSEHEGPHKEVNATSKPQN